MKMIDNVEIKRVFVLGMRIQKELQKFGKPKDVLPATLLVILMQARDQKVSLEQFMKSVKAYAKAFGVFDYE